MIGYVLVGTNDLPRATRFFDSLLAELGAKRFMEFEKMVIWGTKPDAPMLGVCSPYNGNAATVGNGTMVALNAGSKELVHKIYDKAIALGATCDGAPGPRGDDYYGGYFRDLDGNKFVAFVM